MPSKSAPPAAASSRQHLNFDGLLEAIPDALVVADRNGVIRFVNRRLEVMFGYDRDVLLEKSIETLIPESSRTAHQRLREGFVADPKTRLMGSSLEELRGRKSDGKEFPVDISLSATGTGDDMLVIAAVRDMTARSESEEGRRRSDRLAAVVEFSGEAIVSAAPDGIITSWNPAAERLYGYTSAEIIGKSVMLLYPENRVDEAAGSQVRLASGQPVENIETVGVRKDGTVFPQSLSISPILDEDGAVIGGSAVARDLTEQIRTAEIARSLTAAEDLVHDVMGSAAIGIALAELDGSLRVVNHSLCELLGYDEAWFVAHRFHDVIHPDDLAQTLKERPRFLAGSNDRIAPTLRLVRADGTTVWVRLVVVLLRDRDGRPHLLMAQFEDVTAEHDAKEALVYQAFHDPLTGLHNRAWILDSLVGDLLAAKRAGKSVSTLLVDLDDFSTVNDSFGHTTGDEVLAAVAERISAVLRPDDRVGRFGGDSFIIVVQDVRDDSEVERLAERVSASIAADLFIQGRRIVPSATIGIAVSTSTSTPERLLLDTDSALSRESGLRTNCGTRSLGASSWCTTSPSCPLPTPAWWDTKHSSVGCTQAVACFPPGTSSMSPKPAGSSGP